MCNHPRVLAVCLNHELVVFQPLTGNDLDLGSIASYKFYFGPPAPPISTVFLDLCIFLIHPTAHLSVTVHRRITSLCCTFSPPPLLELNSFHLYSIHTLHPPASAARLCASRHMPASSAFSRVRLSPLFRPWPAPRSLFSPGKFDFRGSLRLTCDPASTSLYFSLTPVIFWFLVSCQVAVFEQGQEARAPPLPGNYSPRSSPLPTTFPFQSRSRYPDPPPSYPSPLCCLDPIPVG